MSAAPRRQSRMRAPLMLCVLLAGCVGAPASPARADRVGLNLRIDPDGSLLVDEAWVVQMSGTGPASFARDIPGRRSDGFTDVAAAFDGTPLTEGVGPGHLAIVRSDGLRVRWLLPDGTGGPHEFRLTFRALGVLEVKGLRGRLDWPLLGGSSRVDIGSASVDLEIPGPSTLFATPAISPGNWNVRRADGRTIATVTGVEAGDWPVTLRADLTVDQLKMPVPAWQMTEDRIGEMMPAFVSGGLFLLVIGVGAILMLAAQHRRGRPAADASEHEAGPPAVDLALARGGRPSARDSTPASVVGLVGRGLVRIDEAGRLSGLRAATTGDVPGLGAHETVALEVLSGTGTPTLGLDQARVALASSARRVTRALADDLIRLGLVGRDRLAVRRGLYVAGIAVVVFGVACAGLVPIMRPRYGWWPAALPIGVFVDGVLFLAYAPLFSVLTDVGAIRAAQARRRLKGRAPGTPVGREAVEVGVALGLSARAARALASPHF